MKEQITIVWHWEDVQERDNSLTKSECCEILEIMERGHDATIGISWDTIDINIAEYKRINKENK